MERIFKVDDVFGEVFCTFKDEETDRQELIQAMEIYQIEEVLGIDIPESEDE